MDFELYINWGVVGIIVLIALVVALLAANIKVVPQAHAFVIERLGAYHATWSTGLHLKIPFIDRIAKQGLAQGAGRSISRRSLLSRRIT